MAAMPERRWVVNVDTLVPVASLTALQTKDSGEAVVRWQGGEFGQVRTQCVCKITAVATAATMAL